MKQIDFDGTFDHSPEVEVAVELPGSYYLSEAYPNPFNPATRFTLTVIREQSVRITVFDALGRHVALLYDGRLSANEPYFFMFEAGRLPSGVYVIQATGETFQATREVMLVK